MAKYLSLVRRHETTANELREAVRDTFNQRDRSKAKEKAWSQAASKSRNFRSAVDDWIEEFEQAKSIDWEDGREFVFDYLDVDPMYFRSGYIKETLLRFINKIELTANEAEIMRQLVLRRIMRGGKREFRQICRFIPKIQTRQFEAKITEFVSAKDASIAARARIAHSYIVESSA